MPSWFLLSLKLWLLWGWYINEIIGDFREDFVLVCLIKCLKWFELNWLNKRRFLLKKSYLKLYQNMFKPLNKFKLKCIAYIALHTPKCVNYSLKSQPDSYFWVACFNYLSLKMFQFCLASSLKLRFFPSYGLLMYVNWSVNSVIS